MLPFHPSFTPRRRRLLPCLLGGALLWSGAIHPALAQPRQLDPSLAPAPIAPPQNLIAVPGVVGATGTAPATPQAVKTNVVLGQL